MLFCVYNEAATIYICGLTNKWRSLLGQSRSMFILSYSIRRGYDILYVRTGCFVFISVHTG